MQPDLKKYLPNLLVVLGIIAFVYIVCYPQLQGKALLQGDIQSWKGMAKEGMDWHEKTGENVLWSNSQFGGMPTYSFYVPESNNYVSKIHVGIVSLLGRPAALFFIAMLCFFLFMRVLKIDMWLSLIGSVAFAFTTYNIDSIVAGHETKVFALGYLPAVLGGLILIYQRDWWKGIPLLAISLSLMMGTGHYQIMYYAIIIIVFMAVGFLLQAIKGGTIKEFFISSAVCLAIALLAVGLSLQNILPMMEYNKMTMRGGQSELTIVGHDNNKKSGGLDKDYAFAWSTGMGETFCLMIPYLYGGGDNMPIEKAEKFAEVTGGQTSSAPLYWGPQPFLGANTYFGAIICFLFIFGAMIVRSPHKWWIIALAIVSIMMSWGRHLPELNYFLFDYLPGFNKFRTPSMIQSITQIMFPLMAMWGVHEMLNGNQSKEQLLKKMYVALGVTAGMCLLISFSAGSFFNFTGGSDAKFPENMKAQLIAALKEDRQALASSSALTSAILILIAGGVMWAYLKGKLTNVKMVIGALGLLIVFDMLSVTKTFLTEDNYVDKEQQDEGLQPRQIDTQIMQDKSYYRVLDLTKNTYNDATQSYFHKCIGGYSPAKMEQYQDMIDVHMSRGFNTAVLNMLNAKYYIYNAAENQPTATINPDACGNAWFVDEVKWVNSADSEMLSMQAGKLGDTAVVADAFNPKHTAVMRNIFEKEMSGYTIGKDSAANITLTKYGLQDLSYVSKNSTNGLAVFSDIYYPYGWKAYVDGKETEIMKANYILRAIKVPAGEHKIEFKFHPDSFYKGGSIAMICSLLILGLTGFSLVRLFKQKQEEA
jgi:hypothetical protein